MIRGGKGSPKAVRVNDLTDVRRGLSSAEFNLFSRRLKKEQQADFAERAVVLLSPSRTFSLILPNSELRETLGQCILYLLE